MEFMIDTWFFASFCLFCLAVCAVIRIIPGPTHLDRIVAANSALSIAAAGALLISIPLGNIFFLKTVIVVSAVCYIILAVSVLSCRGENA